MSAMPHNSAREKAIAEWRRRKRNGEHTGPTGHLKYGILKRPVLRGFELERPPLSFLTPAEMERLEARL